MLGLIENVRKCFADKPVEPVCQFFITLTLGSHMVLQSIICSAWKETKLEVDKWKRLDSQFNVETQRGFVAPEGYLVIPLIFLSVQIVMLLHLNNEIVDKNITK